MSLKDKIMAILPESGNLNACFTCGICASGCPASGLADMDPRKFIRLLSLGIDEHILSNNWVWMCTTCNRCLHVCPMKIDIPQLVFLVRSYWPENKRPGGIVDYCRQSGDQDSCSVQKIPKERFESTIQKIVKHVNKSGGEFAKLDAPIDKKGAVFFLNQISDMVIHEPIEMGPLWKILHLAKANWTYGSKGWAAENYCMFLADETAWENLVIKKTMAIEDLECKVLLNTECGHDFFAVKKGLEKFNIPHRFEVKSIIEYYAQWIREGRLNVNSDWNLDLKIKFTVQDPCQLVRKSYGDFIAEELRFVIKEVVGEENFIDMSPNCSNNYCCGGGGGAIRTDFNEERLSYGKVKLDQILETGAAYCITPCNNCHSQILELSQYYHADLNTIHLWTVLALSLGVLDKAERKYLGSDLAMVGLQNIKSE
ncbi:MAG: (Fe-S)-binding protein [Desulfobacula sp.]|nr:(Fe-S)-binding protein [Desulfobacula sp.]